MDLLRAVISNDEKSALEIIEQLEDVNIKFDDQPILNEAIKNDVPNVVHKLLDKKAIVNATNFWKASPIWYATNHNMEEIAIRLIDLGADINQPTVFGSTALGNTIAKKLTKVLDHLTVVYRNSILDILNDKTNVIAKCFDNGDLNLIDIINDYLTYG